MLLRRKFATAVCATAVSAAALTSCGFDYATDQPYDQAAGTNSHEADVDVLNAVVVASQDDSGTFVAGLANNVDDAAISLVGVSGADAEADIDPVEIPASGFVNLADAEVHLTGSFGAGDILDLTVAFDDGTEIALEVPVVRNCDEFAGYDTTPDATEESDDPRYTCEFPEHESGH
jgi:copper(I)-binding protein